MKAVASLLLALGMITPVTIGSYIQKTMIGGRSSFCQRYDNGNVQRVYERWEATNRLNYTQISSRVRRQMRGANFARDAALAANLPRITGCHSRVYMRFSRTRFNKQGQVLEMFPKL